MTTWGVVVVLAAVTMNAVSGVLWVARPRRVLPGLQKNLAAIGVPESWATFPIGTLKLAGAAGLLAGLVGVPYVGTAAAAGLILFWVCAIFSHVRVGDWSTPQFYATSCVFLPLAAGALAATVV
ncbi:DoxX family protein [Isoptericola sp. NPDC057653]|uniref:DoxX family protein n=1 Tax=unclassified Isoptericola TaxID=2623355 RepID=UPI0036CD2A8A